MCICKSVEVLSFNCRTFGYRLSKIFLVLLVLSSSSNRRNLRTPVIIKAKAFQESYARIFY